MMGSLGSIQHMARWMAGHYSNFQQAIDQPVWFAHIHVYQCPLAPHLWGDGSLGFYVEQAYDIYPNAPYRQRILQIRQDLESISIQNYALKDSERWSGSGHDLDKLDALTLDDIETLSGCITTVEWTGSVFKGSSIPGKTCRVFRKERESYLHSEFEIGETHFRSLDQGRDPETDKVIWGSLSGSFEFVKRDDFAERLADVGLA